MAPGKLRQACDVEFLDIRHEKREQSLLQATLDGLDPEHGGERSLPTLLLYDGQYQLWLSDPRLIICAEHGLKLFEQITYLDEYYLTNAEIDVLRSSAEKIVERIAEGTQLIE